MRFVVALCAVVSCVCVSAGARGQAPVDESRRSVSLVREEANAAYGRKDYRACAMLFGEAAGLGSGRAAMNDHYNSACCYAREGDADKAFAMLAAAIEAGYQKRNQLRGDSDLVDLHADPRWEKMLSTVKAPVIRITDRLTTDPAKAPFVYADVEHFLQASKQIAAGADAPTTLEKEYFGKATPGLKQFVVKYGLTAEAMAAAMKKRPAKYAEVGERLSQLRSREDAFRASMVRFKEVVPQVVFPPTYFLVSDYGGVASGSPDGQLITIERRTRESIGRMETLLAHELFHFQQLMATGPDDFYALFGEKKSLLGLSIREGAAEFIAKQITGRITQPAALEYVLKNEREVWRRFQSPMTGRDTSGWLWSTPSDPDQPRDVGYALGSRIVEAYYAKAADKGAAMGEILGVTDYSGFLSKSEYAKGLGAE